jgi:hypothetical protein
MHCFFTTFIVAFCPLKGHNKSGKKQCIRWFNYLIKKMHGGNSVKFTTFV